MSGCGGAHAAFGARSAERCSRDRAVSARLTGHFLQGAGWTAMSLGAEIATGAIRRSGTGAATQTHISAGANQDTKIQITKTATVTTDDKQSLRGKNKMLFSLDSVLFG